jgi:5-methyltetrahydrofolate--homocysteine methyltransferase
MILALGSAAITGVAITVHTRSPWITLVGLLQVILSFPLSYFVYKLIAGLEFFPFINFMGVFVAFALGADIVFVAADKWKNARLNNRKGSTEDIAAVALPDAAGAMALTTSTTAVAFFGTAICPVAPLKCFAIFCGLLIVFDYILNILLIFPALCIYDKWQLKNKDVCFCCCNMGKRSGYTDENLNAKNKTSLIHGILSGFYRVLHAIRWPLFVICIAAAIVSAVFAARIELPNNSDVRMLKSSVQYEQNYEWRINLLSEVMEKKSGAPGYVIWGVTPADTGDHNNPATSSQLVLDDRFDASTTEGQTFLMNFCDRLFAEEFAGLTRENYTCPLNQFDSWLSREATSETPSSIYADNCAGVTGLPMPPKDFNPCITAWTNAFNVTSILERNGVVKIMYIEFQQRIRYDSRYDDLNDEWHIIEHWFENERASAPEEVNKVFHSSGDFAWYDTNGSMLQTAYGSAAIALAFSSLVVLISSRSVVLTLFSLVTIGYVLTATTALLVAIGWTLGFLESICFAILIGISCDFVIHFGHAYASLPGIVSRDQRTKFALIHMGPSILAAAFTTIASAIVMIFTVNTFFVKFAIILFFTILQATVGSFIVFLTFTDCVGPNEPTYLWDKIAQRCQRRRVDDAEYAEGDTSVLDMDKTIATKAAHEDSFDR